MIPGWNLAYFCSKLLNKFKTMTADTFYLCTQTFSLEELISSKRNDLDVTDCSQTTYDHWLQLYDEDIDKYLETVNQEHIIDLN